MAENTGFHRRGTAFNLPGISNDDNSDPSSKLIIVMVGLPARGKSYITNKLTRYLNWLQLECRVFNVGNKRRSEHDDVGPSTEPLPPDANEVHVTSHDANFFKPNNKEAFNIREKWAMDTLDDLLDFLLIQNGSVGIFDATNSTFARRLKIYNKVKERNSLIKILYLESICTDDALIQKNIKLKLNGPDYLNKDKELALQDFKNRLKNYESAYQTIEDEEEYQYIKIINVGKKIITYNIQGFLPSQTIYYLLNFNLGERQLWITRNGESKGNVNGRIGGDSLLTSKGDKFSNCLSRFITFKKSEFLHKHPSANKFYNVWSSCLKRSVQTANHFNKEEFAIKQIKLLNDLSCGEFDDLTYNEFQNLYPSEFQSRLNNKINYRYPGASGESYLDVINRIKPIINEIERTSENLVIISHRVIIRILLSYFLNLDKEILTNLDVPLNHVFLLEPKPFGVEWTLFKYNESNDWFDKVDDDEFLKVKEKDVEFNKRRYSVVPISTRSASSHSLPKPDFLTSNIMKNSSTTNLRNPASNSLFKPTFHDHLSNSLNKDRIPRSLNKKNPFDPNHSIHNIEDDIDPIIEDVKNELQNTKI